MHRLTRVVLSTLLLSSLAIISSQDLRGSDPNLNREARLESFRDLGFGMFIHWSVDGQLAGVISHSMVGADDEYVDRYINELPKTFNPRKFHPEDWAAVTKLAGMKHVVFTAKHHSGFTIFKTATTDYGVMNTPFKRDITAEVLAAFREQGIAPGLYYSPDDLWWLHSVSIENLSRSALSRTRGVSQKLKIGASCCLVRVGDSILNSCCH
jgi:alpha-L-fucosidase